MDRSTRIHALLHAILRFLEKNRGSAPEVDQVVDKMRGMDLSLERIVASKRSKYPHCSVLTDAINDISAPGLFDIAECLRRAQFDLSWRVDHSQYYAPDADLGAGYRDCNLHTLLIGPNACGIDMQDFCLGLFMLGPRTLYRDHAHCAPELYVNLSRRSGWRLSLGDWQDYGAGSIIWNPSGQAHAIRSYDRPFLSIFVWLENVDSMCRLVPFSDWAAIEASLSRNEL